MAEEKDDTCEECGNPKSEGCECSAEENIKEGGEEGGEITGFKEEDII